MSDRSQPAHELRRTGRPMTLLTWVGHSTVLIETAGQRLLTDPVLGRGIGPIRRRAPGGPSTPDMIDAVLISHLHHDHLDIPSLRFIQRDVPVVVPAGGGRLLRAIGFTAVHEVGAGDRTNIGRVAIEAVPARHSGRRLPFGPSAPALGYVIDGDQRIYFAGDTALYPGMAELARDLDLAILPVGGWGPTLRGGHMDPARAADALALLRPRIALPVHWGTLWPIGLSSIRRSRFEEPARQFELEAARAAPEVRVALLDPGGRLVMDADGSIEVHSLAV